MKNENDSDTAAARTAMAIKIRQSGHTAATMALMGQQPPNVAGGMDAKNEKVGDWLAEYTRLLTAVTNAAFDCGAHEDTRDTLSDTDDAYEKLMIVNRATKAELLAFLENHNAELARDKARLDWLLEKQQRFPIMRDDQTFLVQEFIGHTTGRGETKREAIDAAMAMQPQPARKD